MKIIERIKLTMKERNIKQIDLAKAVGVGKSTINAWFNNNSDPKAEQLPPIAELLGTSLDFLITGQERGETPQLTIDEEHLIKNYRLVTDKGKGRIQETAREMVKLYPYIDPYSIAHKIQAQITSDTTTVAAEIPIEVISVTRRPGGPVKPSIKAPKDIF